MPELNATNIIPPRVELTDPRTGLISREWYRFFLNLFNKQTDDSDAAALAPVVLPSDQMGNAYLDLVGQVDLMAVAPTTNPHVINVKPVERVFVNVDPYEYTNKYGCDIDIIVEGAGITSLSIYRTNTWYKTGQFHGMFRLSPFDKLKISNDTTQYIELVVLPR